MDKVHDFLAIADQFRLGHLTTEGQHHLSKDLSHLALADLQRATEVLKQVDHLALLSLERNRDGIWDLYQRVTATLARGDDILLVGCGATGRLSLVLETLSLQMQRYPGRIRAFMAGGDYALIKSVESFEDRTPYGERQLHDLVFKDGDLLLAITEGGETPFVIGACLEAARISHEAPWFLYCNPDVQLEGLRRCQEVLGNPHVQKLNLTCGAMALTGSTRMQASTIQMAAAGLALLFDWKSRAQFYETLTQWREWCSVQSYQGLVGFIEKEAATHAAGGLTTYLADPQLAISLLTDTTERSPTFTQPAFENVLDATPAAPIYLAVDGATSAQAAWELLLGRAPRCLTWPELTQNISEQILMGFDISQQAIARRGGDVVSFHVRQGRILWQGSGHQWSQEVWGLHPLWLHLNLKMALNILSTLVMGRRGFYLDNVMSWVKPSNNKLIDRATRYVQLLAGRRGVVVKYEDGVRAVIEEMEKNIPGPVVIRVLEQLGIKI